jgi:hypothetical protein
MGIERLSARFNCRRIKVAAALSGGDGEVVDLDDSR